MTTRNNNFVTNTQPWLIGMVAFIIFVVTLNHWVSLGSLGIVARVAGWLWRPQLEQPLTAAIFYPFKIVPEAWLPLVLNLFTAACAAIVLMLLARSVALLPHDVTRNEPFPKQQPPTILSISTAWIPPLLAVILCALQLSFWEHATSATGEMIDLLVFAYIIRCLLEFRLDQKQCWLSRAAFVFGAGMANNWAMLGLFPVFLIAIIRAKGYGPFREGAFLRRMFAWGLAGLSLFLLLPLVQALSPHGQVDFWTALKAHLKSQVQFLGYLQRPRFRILALASLLPFVVLSIRWKSHTVQFGDDTRLGNFLTKATVHIVHGLFFVISLWIALDPTFSPRNLDLGTPMLTYYYLSALVFGYCAGYFLLFGSRSSESQQNFGIAVPQRAGAGFMDTNIFAPGLITAAGIALVCILSLLMLWRNLRQILETNGPEIKRFASDLYADLPGGKSVVLSEAPVELLLLEAYLSGTQRDKEPMLVDAPSLASRQYSLFMGRRFPFRWPISAAAKEERTPVKVLQLICALSSREPLVYLHPDFGPLFELFTATPHGSTCILSPRANQQQLIQALSSDFKPLKQTNTPGIEQNGRENGAEKIVRPQTLAAEIVNANEEIWNKRWPKNLQILSTRTKEKPKYSNGIARPILSRLYLARHSNLTTSFIGLAYSKRLNNWGVQTERTGHAAEATTWFRRAVELNPENLAAHINLEYSQRSPAEKSLLTMAAIQNSYPDLFAKFKNWREILKANGPVDEPSYLFQTARVLLETGNPIQAIESFLRCLELAPKWGAPKLWLARTYLQSGNLAAALDATEELQKSGAIQDGSNLARLLHCRVNALSKSGRTNEAAACLESFVAQYGKHGEVLSAAAELYSDSRKFDEEFQLLEELLKREPGRLEFLCRKGMAQLELGQYQSAVSTLTAVLNHAPRNEYARLYRAIAYLGLRQFEAARSDYQELLNTSANPRNALFGLGTVAWSQAETNLAIKYYQQYISNQVSQTRQDILAAERLAQLRQANLK